MGVDTFVYLRDRLASAWVALVGITIVCALGASHVELEADLSRLLPADTPSVAGLERLERNYGDQIGRLTVVLQGGDRDQRRDVAAQLRPELAVLPGIDRLTMRPPSVELGDTRLLFADIDDLRDVEQRLRKRLTWEKARANPLFASLDDSPPPSLDVSTIQQQYLAGSDTPWFESGTGHLLIFVHPSFPASDLAATRRLVRRVDATVEARLSELGSPVSVELTGRYQKRIEQQDVLTEDMTAATSLAALLLGVFLWVYFRQLWSVVLVVIPLLLGLVAAAAAAWLMVGELNVLTGFLGAVLLGIGVDYGIHLVSRLSEVGPRCDDPVDALVATYSLTGRANIYAAVTTVLAVGVLGFSGFKAFHEFGLVASAGLTLILAAYFLVLPMLVLTRAHLRGRLGGQTPAVARTHVAAVGRPREVGALPPGIPKRRDAGLSQRRSFSAILAERLERRLQTASVETRRRRIRQFARVGLVTAVLVVAAGTIGMTSVSFDRSFERLVYTDSPTWELDTMVNKVLGASQTPAVVLVDNDDHRDAVVEELERRKSSATHHHLIGNVMSTRDLVPLNQQAKRRVLERIRDLLTSLPRTVLRESSVLAELRTDLDRLSARSGTLQLRDLPRAITAPFSRRDDPNASVVLVMPNAELNDWLQARRFSSLVTDLPGPAGTGGTVSAISDSHVLVDIFDRMEAELRWMLPVVVLAMACVGVVAFGLRRRFWMLATLLVGGMVSIVGMSGLLGLPLNFMSALVAPVIIGLAVDAAFHSLLQLDSNAFDLRTFVATQGAIAASYMTTMIGFGALMLSHHSGLESMGLLAVVSLGVLFTFHIGAVCWLAGRCLTGTAAAGVSPESSP